MKRIFAAIAFLGLAFSAGAQNIFDAMTYSQNSYYGTARTMALGNAVTAVGGDLGTVGINPAGSAVAGYGQFTITPGLSFSATTSYFSPIGDKQFGVGSKINGTRKSLPNMGVSFVVDTGNDWGLKSMTFAMVSNQTNQYFNMFGAAGHNSSTSRLAELAATASNFGYNANVMGNYDSFYDSDYYWDVIAAYRANCFGGYGDKGDYAASSEYIPLGTDYHYVPGQLNQSSTVERYGAKHDIVLNMGMNFNDNFFLGFNLGIPTLSYQYYEHFSESPENSELFPVTFKEVDDKGKELFTDTYFKRGATDYSFITDIDGIYAKVGAIFLPTDGLRLGAAIQTPTSYTITETWQNSASSSYANSKYNASESSPVGDYTYCLRSPYIVDFGAAYTFGANGFISVDYELADYSVMRFSDIYDHRDVYDDPFLMENEVNHLFAGVSHSLRVGAEVKLTPMFAIRAGYSLITSPERYAVDEFGGEVTSDLYMDDFYTYHDGNIRLPEFKYYGDKQSAYSAGFGFSSNGSFFADFAVRLNKYENSYFSPYYDYANFNSEGLPANTKSPRVMTERSLWDAVLTLGWRF